MENYLIKQRIYELSQKEHLDSETNELLLQQYHQDKQSNIPTEQSEARELLVMGNEKLVFRIMLDTFGIHELTKDREEYSVGMMGLLKAVDTFDINRKVAFSTYASQVIINEIRMEYRKNKKHNHSLNKISSINDPVVGNLNGDIFFLEDCLGEEDDTIKCIIREESIQTIKNNFKYLKEEEMLSVIYGYGLFGNKKLKQNEIAEMLGVNQSYISRMMRCGRYKLKLLITPSSELSANDLEAKLKLLNHNSSGSDNDLDLEKAKQLKGLGP